MSCLSVERKEAILRKLLPPYTMSVKDVSEEEGISTAALYHWRQQLRRSGAAVPNSNTSSEQWIRKQQHVFPECEYQHVTLTLPHTLWPIFRDNRFLLNHLFSCADKTFLGWAEQLGIDIGGFCRRV